MTTPSTQTDPARRVDVEAERRELARRRLERKRKFYADVVAYLVVNAFFVVLWAMGDRGAFWPGWVMAGWGGLLLLDAYRVYLQRPVTEADVDEELHRLG